MRLDPYRRLRISLAQRGLVDEALAVIEHNIGNEPPEFVRDETGLYAAYPFFRDHHGFPDAWYFITDKPVEMMAHQLAVEAVAWKPASGDHAAFVVRATSPFDEAELRRAGLTAVIGRRGAKVSIIAPDDVDGRTTLVFEWLVSDLAAEAPRFGGRLDTVIQTTEGGQTYRAPLRLPARLPRPRTIARTGFRLFVIRPVKQPERELALEYKLATRSDLLFFAKRRLKQRVRRLKRRARRLKRRAGRLLRRMGWRA